MNRICLENVSLVFRVRKQRRVPFKDYLLKQMFRESRNPMVEIEALRNVSIDLRDGARLGIIGRNGAGKSTMLKVLAGIYPPTQGVRHVQGRVSALFDTMLGFERDATGWENIAYRGYLQGETPRSIAEKRHEIAEFSELGEFLDMPVRYYSAGMAVRLAFSIVTTIEPQILLVDEALGAGDLSFQQKARRRMMNMVSRAKILILVSHDLGSISDLCDRVIWIDEGQVRADGPAKPTVNAYRESTKVPQPVAA